MKKNIGWFFAIIGVLLCMAGANSKAAENPVDLQVWAVLGPLPGQPDYQDWAVNTVNQIYTDGSPAGALGSGLRTEYIAQPEPLRNARTIWFVVSATSKSASYMFPASQLVFVEDSNDPSDSLHKSNTFTDPSFIYAPQVLGIKWNGAPGANDTKVVSGPMNTPVNRVVFVGSLGTFYTYQEGGFPMVDAYIHQFANYSLTGKWSLVDAATGQTLGSAEKTLSTSNTTLTIRISRNGVLSVSGIPSGRSVKVQSSSSLGASASWQNEEGTLTAGQTMTVSTSTPSLRFFRAVLQ